MGKETDRETLARRWRFTAEPSSHFARLSHSDRHGVDKERVLAQATRLCNESSGTGSRLEALAQFLHLSRYGVAAVWA